jgi:L-rhamnose isomerase
MTHHTKERIIKQAYDLASEVYAEIGVNTEKALATLETIPISLHCWQGDDVGGFENQGIEIGGGLAVTGNYPGKARSPEELRSDLEMVYKLLPGKHRLSLHAMYAEFGGRKKDRNEILPEHFVNWADWAKENQIGIDFNPSLFAHPKASSGFTLSSSDLAIRQFWIDHCIASRKIGEFFGKTLGTTCINNIWIPDGYKDTPIDRKTPRQLLLDSLDQILAVPIEKTFNKDSVEGKLFGIGSESYTTGSHEFYLGYAITRRILYTLDTGHYHPTETISDKISSVLFFIPEILLHVSRGVRWDSDHVVIYADDLQAIAHEIVRGNYMEKVHIGLDYFDASINRIAAWTIGARNTLRALLFALLEPTETLSAIERAGDFTKRLASLEALKQFPAGAVWDYYCMKKGVPVGMNLMTEIEKYEKDVLSLRD